MRNRLICFYAVILCLCVLPSAAQVENLSTSNYGIWQSFGDPISRYSTPELRGRLCNFRWADLEPQPDVWDWTDFDNQLSTRAQDSLPIIFMVYTKEDAPDWLFTHGVPKVLEKDNAGNVTGYAPYYPDPEYKSYFKDMVTKVHQHVETLPSWIRNKIIAVQGCYGSTGDYISYKDNVDPQYALNSADFFELFKDFSQTYYDEYKPSNPPIKLLSNPQNDGPDQAAWIFSNIPDSWIKTGTLGKGFQLNDEGAKYDWLYSLLNSPNKDGEYMRSRSEIIGGATLSGWWNEQPYKNMFAMLCYDIYWGLDWSNQGFDQLNDNNYDSAFGFYNKYAGEKNALTSAYAMCALRDGLDASDGVRFPASKYGSVTRSNTSRYKNIVADFAANGALLEDPSTATMPEINNLSAKGTNDVGWDVFSNNYDRFLHQINPNQTSVGYWNIQSSDPKDMFGKFARGFDLASGKDALYFDLEDGFLNNTQLNGAYPVVVEIVYLDEQGSWQLFYDGKAGANTASMQVNCTNTKKWKRASITISDAYFGNRGTNASDFYIKNTGSGNVKFSIVELRRPSAKETVGLSSSALQTFDTTCVKGSTYQTLYVSGCFLDGSPVQVGPMEGFQFSADNGATYVDSVIVSGYGASFSQKLFIKFYPKTEGSYTTPIPVSGGNSSTWYIPVNAVGVNSSPALNPQINAVSCYNAKDGSIILSPTGGIGSFSYSWTGPGNFHAFTPSISNLTPADYTVTVNSLGGCSLKKTYTITQPDQLSVSYTYDNMECKNGTTKLEVIATGGNTPYTGTGVFYVGPGNYQINVSDANGCAGGTKTAFIPNGSGLPPAKPTSILSPEADINGVCNGGTYGFTANPVSGASYYSWTIPSGSKILSASLDSSNVTVQFPAGFNGGQISVAAANTCGIGTSYTRAISAVPAAPVNILGPVNVSAKQSGLIYTVDPVINGLTYSWTVPAGATLQSGDLTPSATVTWSNSSAKMKVTASNACGTSSFATLDVSVVAKTTLSSSTNTLASFGDVCVNASSDPQYFFLSGALLNGSALTVGPATGFTFSDAANGSYSNSLSITGYGSTVNQNIYVRFTPQSAKSYNASIPVSGGGATSLSVTATGNGVNNGPALQISSKDISCYGAKDGVAEVTVQNATGSYTYSWSGPSGFTSGLSSIDHLKAGQYSVTVTTAGGCSSTASVTINEPAKLTATVNAGVIQSGQTTTTTTVNANGGTAPYSGTGVFTVGAGTYTYTVTDNNGCAAQKTVTIDPPVLQPPLDMTITSGSITCYGGSTSVTVSASGGNSPYTGTGVFNVTAGTYNYTVTDANGKSVTKSLTISQPAQLDILAVPGTILCNGDKTNVAVSAVGGTAPYTGTGNFNVSAGNYTYNVTDNNGCTAGTTVSVTEPSKIQVSVSAGQVQVGQTTTTATISAVGGTAPYFGTGTFTLTAGTYTYTITDANGCNQKTTFVIDQALQPLQVAATAGTISCYGGSTSVKITASGGKAPYTGTGTFTVAAGTYVYIVTDANGSKTSTTVTIDQPQQLTASSSAGQVQLGQTTTVATISASGGTAPYTGTGNFNLGVGTYTYNISDANGCKTQTTFTIDQAVIQTLPLEASAISGTINCNGGTTFVVVNATGGKMPYNGTGTFSVKAGSYTYTVTDADGNTTTASINIAEPLPLQVSSQITTPVLCNGNYATVAVTAAGGTAPYTGIGNFSVVAGAYDYTVTDKNGCLANTSVSVVQPDILNVTTLYTDIPYNQANTTVEVNATGGTAPYTGTGNFVVTEGTYNYTVTDANGCNASAKVSVSKGVSQLQVSAVAGNIKCFGGTTSVAVTATGGTAPYTGTGNFNAAAGTYTYTVKDAGGQTASVKITITQPSALNISALASGILCNGGTANIVVSATGGAAPYTGTGNFTVGAGTYTYNVTDANGCTSSIDKTVTEPETLSIVTVSQSGLSSCNGTNSSLEVLANGGTMPYNYSIDGSTFQQSNSFTDVADGSYTVTVKDNNGCVVASLPQQVVHAPAMVASMTNIANVSGCNSADGAFTVAVQGGVAPYQYSLNNGDIQNANVFSNLPAGNYSVAIFDSRGCATSVTTQVKQDAPLQLDVAQKINESACANNNGSFAVITSGGSGNYLYSLNNGAFTTQGAYGSLAAGNYSLTVKDNRGCTQTTKIKIDKEDALDAYVKNLTNASSCTNNTGSIVVGKNGGEAPFSYSINGGAFQSDNTFSNLSTGVYLLRVKDNRGCSSVISTTVNQLPELVLAADTTAIQCAGGNDGSITINATGGLAPYEYSINGKAYQPSNVFKKLSAGSYNIAVRDENSCAQLITVAVADGSPTCGGTDIVGLPADSSHANDTTALLALKAYPNPTANHFTVVFTGNRTKEAVMLVYDVNGKIIYKQNVVSGQPYTFGDSFASGMYLLQIEQDNRKASMKLLKVK